ncbi:hypothetical protein L6164_003899 [Bauhinia variegata]|uniref:Uncharacterized protein n=1 Tax=Bauhinia variegata TaxID=167791 RepID=A0ACB9Q2S6_BAUVA|nr:hypothetical protein L6164_003899 [Bauhinia variegata]
MADNEDKEEKTSRGNEWEVVTLTESTYAAAPGAREIEVKDGDKGSEYALDEAETGNEYAKNDAETSHALFMSGHFVFPPSEHEFPLEPDSEIRGESGGKSVVSDVPIEEGVIRSGKDEESLTIKGLNVPEEFAGIQFFDEKISKLSGHGKGFDEGSTLQGYGFIDKEGSIYDPAKYSSFHNETDIASAIAYEERVAAPETTESDEQGLNVSPDISQSKNLSEDDKYTPLNLPCGAWWKRRAASLYAHAKETSTFWSIFIAAAVMGLVMLGQRWQQERALQLKWQMNDEARSRMFGPIVRLKDVLVGGHRRGSLISGSSSSAR